MSLPAMPRHYLASTLLVVVVHAILLARLLQAPPSVALPPEVVVVELDMALPGLPAAADAAAPAAPAETLPAVERPADAPPAGQPPPSAPVPAAAAPRPAAPAADAAGLPAPRVDAPAVASAAPLESGTGRLVAPVPDAAVPAALAAAATADVPPRLLPGGAGNPRPPYPDVSRRLRESGVVELLLRVEADGRVSEVRMIRSSGHRRLDQSALRTVRGWVLRPALQAGRPVPAWLPHNIEFNLEN